MAHPVERLRRIWTPGREVEEVVAKLGPGSELDSMIRHFLHAVVQQNGTQRVQLGSEAFPLENTGTLRWETVHGPGPTPEFRSREVTLWIEQEGGG
jgi:hypothetical protein